MKKLKEWLKSYWFTLIYTAILWALFILAVTLKIPEWARWVMIGSEILLAMIYPLISNLYHNTKSRKRGKK